MRHITHGTFFVLSGRYLILQDSGRESASLSRLYTGRHYRSSARKSLTVPVSDEKLTAIL